MTRRKNIKILTMLMFLSSSVLLYPETINKEIILDIGTSFGIPTSVTNQLAIEESSWNPNAIGPVGSDGYRCMGLFQLNPKWQSYLCSKFYFHPAKYFDILNPIDNSAVAIRYLAALHRQFKTWERALWFYNCGSVINVSEKTKAYARRIINAKE